MLVLVVWLGGRVVSSGFLLFYAANQSDNAWTGAAPSLPEFSSLWDGRWYNIIAVSGYPTTLPMTNDGHVAENQWAFLPVYPTLARLLMATGLDWNAAALSISLAAGLGETLMLYRLVVRFVSEGQALFTVVLFSFAPTSPLLQLAYAESLQMLLIVTSLYFLTQHRYGLVLFFGTVLAFTRPGALALALTVLIHGTVRYARRSRESFPVSERIAASMTTGWLTLAGIAWPVIAGIATSVPFAYFETELAWRSPYIGYGDLTPFTPWILGAQWWATNQWAIPALWAVIGLGVVVALSGMLLILPAARRVGMDIRAWCLSYGLYVLAVFFPQSSTWRILAPLFPGLAILAAPSSRLYRVTLVIVFLVGQFLWIGAAWAVSDYDWSPP